MKSMSNKVRSEEKEASPDRAKSPKPTKETWLKARLDYETGNFNGIRDLAERHGLNYDYLRQKIHRENWRDFKVTVSEKVSQKVTEKIENKVDLFLNHLEKKGIYYEKLVEASQAQASRNSEGIPELEPVDLEKYARVEGIAIEWRKSALGINDKQPVSVDLNVNVTAILSKLHEMPSKAVDVESETMECSRLLGELKE